MARVPTFDARERAFYLAYGDALGHWSELESHLGNLFVILTGNDLEMGRAIYYSARSFTGRADMVAACIPFAKAVPQGRAYLGQFINRVRQYSAVRNSLAHDRHVIHWDWGNSDDPPERYIEDQDGKRMGLPHLANAALNFGLLAELLKVSIGQPTLVPEPELSLSLLGRLETDALASAKDLKQLTLLLSELERRQQLS